MRDRGEQILRILCIVLAALMIYRVCLVIKHGPLTGLNIPPMPHYVDTNAVANTAQTNGPAKTASNKSTSGTNTADTNTVPVKNGTNTVVAPAATLPNTNSATTNEPASNPTNAAIAAVPPGTNAMTNAAAATGTNRIAGPEKNGTNAVKIAKGAMPGSNGGPVMVAGVLPPGFPGGPGMRGGPNKLPELPPLAEGRLNKIIVSEIFAPMMHPQPSDLMGIAGNYAFLRSSSGAMGMVKEGDSLGGLKLLKVGINRVLIEEDGEKKELMIFSGFGSETLMPKQKENTNDIARKSP